MRHTLRLIMPIMTALVLLAGAALPVEAALPLKSKRCGALITSSFKLKNNMTCTGDALKIRASGITIDLNGKVLKGDGGDGDFGIDNSRGFDRVTIITGPDRGRLSLITRFYVGIQVGAGGQRNTIRRVGVFGATHDGIDIDGGNGHRVLRNNVVQPGDEGIELNGAGGVIKQNSVLGAHGNGIKVVGDANDIALNDLASSGDSGIWINGDINTIELNMVVDNGGDGILIEDGASNLVTFNEVCGNAGLEINDNGTSTTLDGNTVSEACP
jgi:hypothetical protein